LEQVSRWIEKLLTIHYIEKPPKVAAYEKAATNSAIERIEEAARNPPIKGAGENMSNPQAKTIYTALLAFQADCPILIKDKKAEIASKRTGGKFSYKYIPLANIMESIQGLLTKNGLVWSTMPGQDREGRSTIDYDLIYAPTGEKLEGTMTLILGSDADSRAHGSALSYGRRQSLEAVLNLVAQSDDDGASGSSKQPRGDARPLGNLGREKVRAAIVEAGKNERGLLTAVGIERIEDLTVGSAKAIRQILDGNKERDALAEARTVLSGGKE
jgi:hypothetical protein